MPRGAILWYSDTLTPTLAKLHIAINATVTKIMAQQAKRVQKYAQENAPWEDRTGDARAGLTATAEATEEGFVINLFHTVDYGIWLEIRFAGEYAIIQPTIEEMGPRVMKALDGVLVKSALVARAL